jgi:SAM-dependent methyltransferase
MLDSNFPREFSERYADQIARDEALAGLPLRESALPEWSFSTEWEAHFRSGLFRTWGWTVEERVRQFFQETGTEADWCKGKLILDAGCGNGQLSEGLSRLGATVVAMDYSTSVFAAERARQSSTVSFVRGDLQAPPFENDTFDLVVSNGVLHHTRSTSATFREVARLVKPGGRFYLWLYRRPERFLKRLCVYPAIDLTRVMLARAPGTIQALGVRAYALGLMAAHKAMGHSYDLTWAERVIAAYDVLTPMWKHYHTPMEVSQWFFANGYSAPALTHWDNPYGFGMVATKHPEAETPGVNFGKSGMFGTTGLIRRYWN